MKKTIIILVIVAICLVLFAVWKQDNPQPVDVQEKPIDILETVELPTENNEEKAREHLSKYPSEQFQAGMNILVYGQPNMTEVDAVYEQLRELGVNSLSINFPFYQTDLYASDVYMNPVDTPTISALTSMIERAHLMGFTVMIRPIMDEQVFMVSGKWRGQIQPRDPEKWFQSYTSFLLEYAKLAENLNVKILNIGTELTSMERGYPDQWRKLTENIRDVYQGELMYSFNWDRVTEIRATEWIDAIDYIGLDAYFPLNVPDGATTENLTEAWTLEISKFQAQLPEKPIVITEAGMIPVVGAYRTPYVWRLPGKKVDQQAQANYYAATFQVWQPLSKGIYWWTVTLGENPDDISFSPLNTLTENILKQQNVKP